MSTKVRALGEVAFRVNDLEAMRRFYEEVIGLEVMRVTDAFVFFRLGPGHAGHTQVLALFARGVPVGPEGTTVDHIAFNIDLADYEAERARLEGLGLKVELSIHVWVKWRSLYVRDPEGNLVELVCYDPSIS
jgi:catechol-2,3-dioxygenase